MSDKMLQLRQSFLDSRVLKVLVVPIGDNSLFDQQFQTLTTLQQVHLYNLNRASMKKPFMKYLNWNNGTMLFEFVRYDKASFSSVDLNNFQSSKRIVMILGLVNYSELLSPTKLDEELDHYTRRHGGVLFRSIFVFNYPFDNPSAKGLLNKTSVFAAGGVEIFPPQGVAGEGRSTHEVHLEEVMGHEAVKIITKFDEIMRDMMNKVAEIVSISNLVSFDSNKQSTLGISSGMTSSLLTPYDDFEIFNIERERERDASVVATATLLNNSIGPTTTAAAASAAVAQSLSQQPLLQQQQLLLQQPSPPTAGPVSTVAGAKKKEFSRRKFPGRMKKWLGDMCMQVSSPLDALELYNLSVVECRNLGDDLWLAGALEGYCSALLLLHVSGYYTLDDIMSTPGGKELKGIFENYASNSASSTPLTDRQKIVMLVEERIAEALQVYSRNVVYFNFECECLMRTARLYEGVAEGCVGREEKVVDAVLKAAAVHGLTNMQQAECLLEGAMLLKNPKLGLPRKFGLFLVAAIVISLEEGAVALSQALLKKCFSVYGIEIPASTTNGWDLSTVIAAADDANENLVEDTINSSDPDIYVSNFHKSWLAVRKMLFTLVAKISIARGDSVTASRSLSALLRLVSETERRQEALCTIWAPTLAQVFEKRASVAANKGLSAATVVVPSYADMADSIASSRQSSVAVASMSRASSVAVAVAVAEPDYSGVMKKEPGAVFELADWLAYAGGNSKKIATLTNNPLPFSQGTPKNPRVDSDRMLKNGPSGTAETVRLGLGLEQHQHQQGRQLSQIEKLSNLTLASSANNALKDGLYSTQYSPRALSVSKEDVAVDVVVDTIISTFSANRLRPSAQEEAMNQLYLLCRQLPFSTKMGLPIKFKCLRIMLRSYHANFALGIDSDSPKLIKVSSKALKEALSGTMASAGENLHKSALFFDPFAAKRAKTNEKNSKQRIAMWPRGMIGKIVVFVENPLSVPICLSNVSVNFEDFKDPHLFKLLSAMVIPVAVEIPSNSAQFEIEVPILMPFSTDAIGLVKFPEVLTVKSVAFRVFNAELVVPINEKGLPLLSRNEFSKPWSFPRPASNYQPFGKDVEPKVNTVVDISSQRVQLSIDSSQILVAPFAPALSIDCESSLLTNNLEFKKTTDPSFCRLSLGSASTKPNPSSSSSSNLASPTNGSDDDENYFNRHVSWSFCPGEKKVERIYLLRGHVSPSDAEFPSAASTSAPLPLVGIFDYRIVGKVWLLENSPNPNPIPKSFVLQEYKRSDILTDNSSANGTESCSNYISLVKSNLVSSSSSSDSPVQAGPDDRMYVDISFFDCVRFSRILIQIEVIFESDPLLTLIQPSMQLQTQSVVSTSPLLSSSSTPSSTSSDVVNNVNSNNSGGDGDDIMTSTTPSNSNRRDFLFGRVFSLAVDVKQASILKFSNLQQVAMTGFYINNSHGNKGIGRNPDGLHPRSSLRQLDYMFSNLVSNAEFDSIKAILEGLDRSQGPSMTTIQSQSLSVPFALKPIQATQMYTLQVENVGIVDIEISYESGGAVMPLRVLGLPFPRRLKPLSMSSIVIELDMAAVDAMSGENEFGDEITLNVTEIINMCLLKRLHWKFSNNMSTSISTAETKASSIGDGDVIGVADGCRQGVIRLSHRDKSYLTARKGESPWSHLVYPRFVTVASTFENINSSVANGNVPSSFRVRLGTTDASTYTVISRISVDLKLLSAQMLAKHIVSSKTGGDAVQKDLKVAAGQKPVRLCSMVALDVALVVVECPDKVGQWGGPGSWTNIDPRVAFSGQPYYRHVFSIDYATTLNNFNNGNTDKISSCSSNSSISSRRNNNGDIVSAESPVQVGFLMPGRYRVFSCSRLSDVLDGVSGDNARLPDTHHHRHHLSDIPSPDTNLNPNPNLILKPAAAPEISATSVQLFADHANTNLWWVDPHFTEIIVTSS